MFRGEGKITHPQNQVKVTVPLFRKAKTAIATQANLIDESVFCYKEKLSRDIIYMRKELEDMALPLIEFMELGVVKHLIILGTKGSGKTALADYLLREIQTEYKNSKKKVVTHYINCRQHYTTYKLLRYFLNKNRKPASDTPIDPFMEMIDDGRYHFMIVDEADLLKDDDFFYYVTRDIKLKKLFLIIITNKGRFYKEQLSADVKSSLVHEFFFFDSYNSPQIEEILTKRAKKGLKIYNEEQIKMIAAIATKYFLGDARLGITAMNHVFKYRDQKFDYDSILKLMKDEDIKQKNELLKTLDDTKLLILWLISKYDQSNKVHEALSKYGYEYSRVHFYRLTDQLDKLDLIGSHKQRVQKSYLYSFQLKIEQENIDYVEKLLKETSINLI